MTKELSFLTNNSVETLALARRYSDIICPGDLIFLDGELGAGKTTFVRGMMRGLGFLGKVKSPSYSLMEQYVLNFTINHFDLYRFKSASEWEGAGFSEFINKTDVNLIEWSEKALDALPTPDLIIFFTYTDQDGSDGRNVRFKSLTSRGEQCIDLLV